MQQKEQNAITRSSHETAQEADIQTRSVTERFHDKEGHQEAENARRTAVYVSRSAKVQGKEKRLHQAERHNAAHDNDREESFEETMDHVRHEMPRSTRPLSRFIHNATIERISEFLAKTVFRPNAILMGGLTAFFGVLALYFYAKYMGFTLQGSETIVTFCAGWLLGILFDLFKKMFTGKE